MVALRGTRRVAIPLAATIILAWFAIYVSQSNRLREKVSFRLPRRPGEGVRRSIERYECDWASNFWTSASMTEGSVAPTWRAVTCPLRSIRKVMGRPRIPPY